MATDEMRLEDGEVLSFPGDEPGARLYCLAGTAWLTQAGDSIDHLLQAGDGFPLHRGGRVVLQALGPALVRVERPAPTASGRFESVRLRARFALLGA